MPTERDAGLQALQQGNPSAAAPLLETACQQNPNDFDALLYLGAAYGQIGRQMDAINTITRAVQIQPGNAQARYNLAVAMEQGGYRDQAVTALEQAVTLQPEYPKAQEALQRLRGGAPAPAPSMPPVGYGQANENPTQAAPAYPAAYPGAGSGLSEAGGFAQQPQPQQPPQGYGAQSAPNPYAPPAANPYAPPAGGAPWAPPAGTSAYPPAQPGAYPYAARPGGAGAMMQTFQPEYAGFWNRFGAAFLDGLIMMVVSVVLGFGIGLVVGGAMGASGAPSQAIGQTAGGLAQIVSLVISWLYFAGMESSERQATFGKQAVGLMVTDLDGNRIGFGRATGRHFAKYLSMILLFIGYIMAAFTEKKQALHDILAGCLVVKR